MKIFLQTLFFFFLVTQISFAQWVQLGLEDKVIKDIAARNSTIFAITSDSGNVYRSTDNGINWLQIIDSSAIDIAISPSGSLFMTAEYGFSYDSVYKSSNNGNTWVNLNIMEQLPSLLCFWPLNIVISPTGIVFCHLRCYGPYLKDALALSTDDGATWTSPGDTVYGGTLFDFRDQSIITSGYYVSLYGGGHIYLSSDNGQSWSIFGYLPFWGIPEYNTVLSMCLNGNILVGGSGNSNISGLFLSSDSCYNWTKISQLIPVAGLTIESGGVLVCNDSLGVFLFSDNGDSLGSRNDGLSNLNVHTFTMDNNGYLYTGTDNGVWRRPLSEITSVEEHSTTIPSSYILSQNFPNPFNPTTKIKYSIPEVSKVMLKLYNLLGEEVATLVNEEKLTGNYSVEFNASSLPSGVYFYRLLAGDFLQARKMILLK